MLKELLKNKYDEDNHKKIKYVMFDPKNVYKECHDECEAEAYCNLPPHIKCAESYKDRYQTIKNNYKYRCSEISDPLEYYCGESYKYINRYLRDLLDECKSDRELLKIDLIADHINEDIYGGQKLAVDTVLYRGVPQEVIDKMKNKPLVIEKAFISTSLLPEIAERYTKNQGGILKLYAPKGTYAMIINNLIDHGRGEFEVLLPTETDMYFMSEYAGMIGNRKYMFYEYHIGGCGIKLQE